MSNYYFIKLGTSNSYLIKASKGYLMVDAGSPSKEDLFQRKLKEWAVDPKEIILVIITHVHYDHVGSLAEIQKITGADVLVHTKEKELLQNGITVFPKSTMVLS